jgi:hypothetical protein
MAILYAVINGDIIGSTKLTEKNREHYLEQLKKVFEILKKEKELGVVRNFEMYRGDSFQGAIEKPQKALKLALLLRSFSRMTLPNDSKRRRIPFTFAKDMVDLRIAVGVGRAKLGKKLMESDGEAFHKSGRLIDSMKKPGINLAIETPWDDLNDQLDASWCLVDALVNKWSPFQAQVVFHTLMGLSQIEIAPLVKASPSAISQRLRNASWPAIDKTLRYFETSISLQNR